VTPYLLTRDNPYARAWHKARGRSYGFWGYPTRTTGVAGIRVIGIHTAESDPSPASAENVARWQRDAAQQPSSYHRMVDSDSTVLTLPDEAVAFQIGAFNTPCISLSFATKASMWGRFPAWDAQAINRAAEVAAEWCRRYHIPLVWLSRSQALGGASGFVRHSVMDPDRRGDPGDKFPAGQFFAATHQLLNFEDDMPLDAADKKWLQETLTREVWRVGIYGTTGDPSDSPIGQRLLRGVSRTLPKPPSASEIAAAVVAALGDGKAPQVDVNELARLIVQQLVKQTT
jgi:hypothetical protein